MYISNLLFIFIKIVMFIFILMFCVAYLTYAERKIIAYIQLRIGPNRVGWKGLLQPFSDVIKLFTKEIIFPIECNKFLFLFSPIVSLIISLMGWSVIPLSDTMVFSNLKLGILFIFMINSMSVYPILIAGWSSNSKYAMLGALRSAAQTISYEIPMGIGYIGIILASNSTNLIDIVKSQSGGIWHWWAIPMFPLFMTFLISAIAENNRAPFDLVEGESEIVAGFHVEYSGVIFAMFFLSEYINMIFLSTVISLLFFGGWLSPFDGIYFLDSFFIVAPSFLWLLIKVLFFLFIYLWIRGTFPRYRYDSLMQLGWKILVPISFCWLIIVVCMVQLHCKPWF
ncbi:NADH-quinone oxidoreductase subunit NuoH [Candidatus Legionella polyplacis]|uniref:NADH-quinone oxidoreductase subunit H n=1 Tax=Candidatus Legionella polyplacis TaxID=2005262 RepID=A0ABZ2H0T8_9GAMM